MTQGRVWGESVKALPGAEVEGLRRLEDTLADALALPEGARRDAHVHLGRDADGHRLTAADLLEDMDRWGIAASVCFPANEPGEDGSFRAAKRGEA